MKRQERARRTVVAGLLENLEPRRLMTMTAAAPLPAVETVMGANPTAIDLDSYFKDAEASADYALINTSLGTIPVLLTPRTTPTAVADFLGHVTKGDYNNTIVSRSVPGSVWQAGGYQLKADATIQPTPAGAAVVDEAGAPAVRGTIALTSTASDGSGGARQFLFNDADNSASPAGGATVFGHVVGPDGLAVMDAVAAVPVPTASPLASPLDQAPLTHYTAGNPLQSYNLTLIHNVTTASEFFAATSNDPQVATATITGNQLTITPVSVGTARVAVVGYGSDGTPAAESLTVTVDGWALPGAGTAATAPVVPAAASLATPVAPVSDLVASASGALPAVVTAGGKAKIAQTVTLTAPNYDVTQQEQVTLSLARPDTGQSFDIATTTVTIKLRANKQVRVNVATNHLASTVPAGAYHLFLTTTDSDGTPSTTDTGATVNVRTPASRRTAR